MSVSTALEGHFGVITTPQSSMDATAIDVRAGLLDAVAAADAEADLHAVILHVVGLADAEATECMSSYEQNPPAPYLADVVARIETSAKPWIAVLHGSINGPNLELALGCHARVSGSDTVFAMPQFPTSAGATVRLPRLIGPEPALDMLMDATVVTAAQAEIAGLVDLVMEDDVHEAAVAFAMGLLVGDLPLATSRRALPSFDDTKWKQRIDDIHAEKNVAKAALCKAMNHGMTHAGVAGLSAERLIFLAHKHCNA